MIVATDAVPVPLTATHPAYASLPAATVVGTVRIATSGPSCRRKFMGRDDRVSVKRNVTGEVTTKTAGLDENLLIIYYQ